MPQEMCLAKTLLTFYCRYVGAVWTLVVPGMDGVVFWGPVLIHTFTDSDSGAGANIRPLLSSQFWGQNKSNLPPHGDADWDGRAL